MAKAGKATISTGVWTELYDVADDGAVTAICVRNDAGSTVDAKLRVTGLHGSGEYSYLAPGEAVVYRVSTHGIKKIEAQGDGGSATVRWDTTAIL